MLPKLRSAVAFPTSHSTYGALPTMSRFGFYPTLFYWMLDFSLAPYLQFTLNSRMVYPNRFFAAFLACTG
jgi:hypothetical protein